MADFMIILGNHSDFRIVIFDPRLLPPAPSVQVDCGLTASPPRPPSLRGQGDGQQRSEVSPASSRRTEFSCPAPQTHTRPEWVSAAFHQRTSTKALIEINLIQSPTYIYIKAAPGRLC